MGELLASDQGIVRTLCVVDFTAEDAGLIACGLELHHPFALSPELRLQQRQACLRHRVMGFDPCANPSRLGRDALLEFGQAGSSLLSLRMFGPQPCIQFLKARGHSAVLCAQPRDHRVGDHIRQLLQGTRAGGLYTAVGIAALSQGHGHLAGEFGQARVLDVQPLIGHQQTLVPFKRSQAFLRLTEGRTGLA